MRHVEASRARHAELVGRRDPPRSPVPPTLRCVLRIGRACGAFGGGETRARGEQCVCVRGAGQAGSAVRAVGVCTGSGCEHRQGHVSVRGPSLMHSSRRVVLERSHITSAPGDLTDRGARSPHFPARILTSRCAPPSSSTRVSSWLRATGSARHRQLCTILQLAGCTEKQKHVCVWLNERFESHEFIRRVRPRNVRTWIGIKPRVQLSKCGTCGACCLRRERG